MAPVATDPDEAARRVANGEPYVIRLRCPRSVTKGVDSLRGEITVDNKNLDDTIIVKTDGLAVYHLAAMVDDHFMKITHVMRGTGMVAYFPIACPDYSCLRLERTQMGASFLIPEPQWKRENE